MTFKTLKWEDPSLFQENLLNLAYNLFKVKYFYEEEQPIRMNDYILEFQTKQFLLETYQEAADEAKVYLKVIQAFRLQKAKLPKEQEYFNYLLEYFMLKEKELSSFELDEKCFLNWLKENHQGPNNEML